MSQPESPDDPLREAWAASAPATDRELRAITAVIREKNLSVRRQATERFVSGMTIAVLMAALTGLAAWRARWLWAGAGYGVCALVNVVAFLVLWITQRRERRRPDPGLATRAYYDDLVTFCDRQARLLESVKYWYALPLLGGIALVGYSIWVNTRSLVMAVVIGAVVPILAWVGIRHNDVIAVNELRETRREAAAWLAEAGMDPDPEADRGGARSAG